VLVNNLNTALSQLRLHGSTSATSDQSDHRLMRPEVQPQAAPEPHPFDTQQLSEGNLDHASTTADIPPQADSGRPYRSKPSEVLHGPG
jgi:hypothetical protein